MIVAVHIILTIIGYIKPQWLLNVHLYIVSVLYSAHCFNLKDITKCHLLSFPGSTQCSISHILIHYREYHKQL